MSVGLLLAGPGAAEASQLDMLKVLLNIPVEKARTLLDQHPGLLNVNSNVLARHFVRVMNTL